MPGMALGVRVWCLLWSGADGKADSPVFYFCATIMAVYYSGAETRLGTNCSVNRRFTGIRLYLCSLVSYQLDLFIQCLSECHYCSRNGGRRSTPQYPRRLDILLERPTPCRFLAVTHSTPGWLAVVLDSFMVYFSQSYQGC